MEYVSGVVIWQNLSDDQIRALAEALVQIHGASLEEEERRLLPDVSLAPALARMRGWAVESGSSKAIRAVEIVSARLSNTEPKPSVFLHGDLHQGNVLFDEGRVAAVIDWEETALGDPRIDLANLTQRLAAWNSPELAERFIGAYDAASGGRTVDLDVWLPV